MCNCAERRAELRKRKWELLYGLLFSLAVTCMCAGVFLLELR